MPWARRLLQDGVVGGTFGGLLGVAGLHLDNWRWWLLMVPFAVAYHWDHAER